jgi:uncharacterized protein (DUF427 family)
MAQRTLHSEHLSARSVPGLQGSGNSQESQHEPRYVIESSPRRVRAMIGGHAVADSTSVDLLFETGRLPVYYFPRKDVSADLLVESAQESVDEVKGAMTFFDVRVGERTAESAAWNCEGVELTVQP